MNLRKTGSGWEFESEAALEDFVWANLERLMGLTALKRQYHVNGQFCDIIAVTENKRLVVLELKNWEDRYIIQQLTRYYDALLEAQPFQEKVDYEQPVHLVAITPKVHKDNLTDIKYHTLAFSFWQFQVFESQEAFYFNLQDTSTNNSIATIEINYQPRLIDINLPPLPRTLGNIIARVAEKEQEVIWQIRKKILTFDERMEEITTAGSIKYGKGKSKFCAEFCLDTKRRPVIFLWLPLNLHMTGAHRQGIGRTRLWTDWKKAVVIAHVPTGLGKIHIVHIELAINWSEKYPLDGLIDMALKKWLEKL